ncbi:MAG: hypothetical protein NTZ13_00705 [Candidatus Parcubacteria bacterium]|nr:hypothetical protein [Candidatus Parcubacteria bacterium]
MTQENITNTSFQEKQEKIPEFFPVFRDDKLYKRGEVPVLTDGIIINYTEKIARTTIELKNFILSFPIGDIHYLLGLLENLSGRYAFTFQTKEYEYGTTELDEKAKDTLGKVVNTFFESVEPYLKDEEKDIEFSSASVSYSAKQIEECADKILSFPGIKLTREELFEQYPGVEVFDLYKRTFGKDFGPIADNKKDRSEARTRIFRIMAKKYLPNWDFIEDEYGFSRGTLRRKKG